MPPKKKKKYPQLVLRAEKELIARVDAFAESQSEPGRECSRGAAVRLLLLRALDEMGKPK